jgi:hypothetical protein
MAASDGREPAVSDHEATDAERAFSRFLEVIGDPKTRAAFTEDPEGTLGPEAVEDLPDGVLGFLEALSEEELALLNRLSKKNREAGLVTQSGEITICHL